MLAVILPAEKLELLIYKYVNALHPPVNVTVNQLSQVTGEKDHGRIVERLKDLDANHRMQLTKSKGGSRLSRSEFGNDGGFFYTEPFLIEIAPQGRKHFEELELRAERQEGPLRTRKAPTSETQLMPPKKAIEILKPMVNNSSFLAGEPFGSPKREQWTRTAEGALARSFAPGSPILDSFGAAQSIVFNADDSDEVLRRGANENLASQVAVLKSAIEQLGWELEEEEPVTPTRHTSGVDLRIFLSHSSKDRALAEALTDLLTSALGLLPTQIRCSSVDGHRLPVGVNTESKLREEVNAAEVVIGLVTPNSLASSYVMFELGARWGADLFLAPLLAGVKPGGLNGPLSLLNSLSASDENQIHQLLDDISKKLGVRLQSATSYLKHISTVKLLADATHDGSAIGKSPEPEIRQVGAVNYYFVGDKGPYCQPCYDEKGKRIFLTPPQKWNGGIRRKCEVCNKFFYEKPMTDFHGPVYLR